MDDGLEGLNLDTSKRKLPVSFLSVVSLGNILILAGMIGTGAAGIYTVGGQMQKLQDAQEHETDMRVIGENNITRQLATNAEQATHDQAAAAAQEARDIAQLTQVLQEMKSDFRAVLQASTPQPEKRLR